RGASGGAGADSRARARSGHGREAVVAPRQRDAHPGKGVTRMAAASGPGARPGAAPLLNAELKPSFDAAAEGKLLVRRCRDCGEAHFYPRSICPHCFSERTEWQASAGAGTVYSYSVMRVGGPFVIAYVTLDEGPTMLTNIVDCDPESVRIGQRVRVVFRPTDGDSVVPMFAPA